MQKMRCIVGGLLTPAFSGAQLSVSTTVDRSLGATDGRVEADTGLVGLFGVVGIDAGMIVSGVGANSRATGGTVGFGRVIVIEGVSETWADL